MNIGKAAKLSNLTIKTVRYYANIGLIKPTQNPLTGFFRTGCCETGKEDKGIHTVCAVMTNEFLAMSKYLGNDLSTPRPEFNFPGLKEGDSWCLCAERWKEAYESGFAPKIYLSKTNKKALNIIDIDILKSFALDLI